MMPFSVFRTWGLGLFSWVLLGLGVYFIYEWSDRANPSLVERPADAQQVDQENEAVLPEVAIADDNAWPYLAAGIALLAWSCFGFLPILPFLGKSGTDDPKNERTGKQQFVERPDGSRLNVEVYGDDHAPTLIFTHGWSLNSTEWHYVKRSLSQRYRVVVWDLPGLGLSRGPTNNDYRLEKMADDLSAVIDAVAPTGRVFLVGHSIGGMIMQTFCRTHADKLRERVAGLVLDHTTYMNPLHTALGAPLWKALEKPLIVPLNYLMIPLAPLAWLSNWQSYLNGSLHITSRITSFAGDQTRGQVDYAARLAASAWPAVVARGNLAMLEFNADPTLPSIETPTLVIGGEHDRLTKIEASRHIDQRLPHGLLTVVQAGHLGLWERHDDANSAIDQFVQKYRELPITTSASASAPAIARHTANP